MRIFQTIFGLTLGMVLLTAGCSIPTEIVSSPQGATFVPSPVLATETALTEASPSSADEAEASPTDIPPVEEELAQGEEQAVLSSFSQPITAAGEPLVLYGHVLDASGAPLGGYAVEIWQVDAQGIYDHPGQANTANRDPGFQFYGTALTDENGLFAFRTIIPARYEPRPRHIHFKIRKDGAAILTSQFYFAGDVEASQLGQGGEMLLLELSNAQVGDGNILKLASVKIVVDTGSGGSLPVTPSQAEGPYYPVIDVAAFDNDLANVE